MQFLPCAWGSRVATTRSERCESKTRPALETLPLSLCLPTLTLLSPRSLAPRFALPPSKLGRCTFLLCFLSSLVWRGLHPTQQGPRDHPGASRQAMESVTSPLRRFGCAALLHLHLIKENIQPRQGKRAALRHFYQKIKQLSLEIKCMARAVILVFSYWH